MTNTLSLQRRRYPPRYRRHPSNLEKLRVVRSNRAAKTIIAAETERKRLPVSAVSKIFTSLIDGCAVPTGRVREGEEGILGGGEEKRMMTTLITDSLVPAKFVQKKKKQKSELS